MPIFWHNAYLCESFDPEEASKWDETFKEKLI